MYALVKPLHTGCVMNKLQPQHKFSDGNEIDSVWSKLNVSTRHSEGFGLDPFLQGRDRKGDFHFLMEAETVPRSVSDVF